MNTIMLHNQIFDVDQISTSSVQHQTIHVKFKNGDQIELTCRDPRELSELLALVKNTLTDHPA